MAASKKAWCDYKVRWIVGPDSNSRVPVYCGAVVPRKSLRSHKASVHREI